MSGIVRFLRAAHDGVPMRFPVRSRSLHSNNSDFALARYNPDGSLDTSLDGDGKLTTTFSSSSADFGNSVAVQSDGKIVIGGRSRSGNISIFALARYNPDGSLDTSFDSDGKLTSLMGLRDSSAESVVVQSDGKIVVVGSSSTGGHSDFAVVRYNANGSLDTTFSGDGKLTTAFTAFSDTAVSVAAQSDGKLVVAGASHVDFAVARYNVDGSLDTTFDADGWLITKFGESSGSAADVVVQNDGKIVLVGRVDGDFAIAAYNPNGTLDATFDGDGKRTVSFPSFGSTSSEVDPICWTVLGVQ